MKQQVAPLSGGFMLLGMFGFLIAVMFVKNYSLDWAFILGSVSAIMFVASMISMTKAPVEEELLLDEHISDRKRRVKIYTLKEYKAHEALMKEKHKQELQALKEAKPEVKPKNKPNTKKTSKKSTKKSSAKKKSTVKKRTKKKR